MGFEPNNLEERLARLFEDQLNLVSGTVVFKNITKALISSIQQNTIEKNGDKIAPNIFQINLSNQGSFAPKPLKDLENAICEWISEYIIEQNYKINGPFSIEIENRDNPTNYVGIKADHAQRNLGDTARINPGSTNLPLSGLEELPQLLQNNGDTFVIMKKTTIIGRADTCDLVIDNLRLSRQHARIVNEQNRFTISDLDSKIGTFVNGNKVRNHVLHPGDVISLGEVDFVFIAEAHSSSSRSSITRKLDLE